MSFGRAIQARGPLKWGRAGVEMSGSAMDLSDDKVMQLLAQAGAL